MAGEISAEKRCSDASGKRSARGGYPGHGETYMNPDDILWWSHGGKLHGESYKRFDLLHAIMSETPGKRPDALQTSLG